jgi:glutathione S-transferase
MKIHLDPISTTSRPLLLFIAEHDAAHEIVTVDIVQGDTKRPEYTALNPNQCVPTLEDGDFILTEGSAILKYLGEKTGSRTYPGGLRARARVNEAMDWFNTGLYRDLGYGVVYPQILPHYRFANPVTQTDVRRRSEDWAAGRLAILDRHWLGGGGFLCGPELTIADYLGSCYIAITEFVGFDISPYPNITRWMSTMKARPSWAQTHGPWNALVAAVHTQPRQTA